MKGVVLPSAGGFVRVHAPPPLGSGGDRPWRGGRLECDPRGCWAQVPVTVLCRLWAILECEVKWALAKLITIKASGGDEISLELIKNPKRRCC